MSRSTTYRLSRSSATARSHCAISATSRCYRGTPSVEDSWYETKLFIMQAISSVFNVSKLRRAASPSSERPLPNRPQNIRSGRGIDIDDPRSRTAKPRTVCPPEQAGKSGFLLMKVSEKPNSEDTLLGSTLGGAADGVRRLRARLPPGVDGAHVSAGTTSARSRLSPRAGCEPPPRRAACDGPGTGRRSAASACAAPG